MIYNNQDLYYKPVIKQQRDNKKNFLQQDVTFDDMPLFFPEGFEKFFLTVYIITLPYIAGMAFLFLYIAHGNRSLFLTLYQETPFVVMWAIGYEIIAAVILVWIVKTAISFGSKGH